MSGPPDIFLGKLCASVKYNFLGSYNNNNNNIEKIPVNPLLI